VIQRSGVSLGDLLYERLGIIVKAALAVAVIVLVKVLLHQAKLEPISTLPMLTSLMAGVVFTLAILLGGTLTDLKESERLVGELASNIRRIYQDLRLVEPDPDRLAKMRAHLLAFTTELNQQIHVGHKIQLRPLYAHLEALDELLYESSRSGGNTSLMRTVQGWEANIVRATDRVETIVETTFMKAGYWLAGTVVAIGLGALPFTDLQPFNQGLFLVGFASFLLLGLFLLIWDLDNPFDGHARISVRQLVKLETFLREQAAKAAPSR
jgi:hypothetical protein